jgi:Tfp pilus assembly PilM family ATPase
LLAGGSAKIPNLSRIIEDSMNGIPTMIMNPFNAISFDPTIFTQDYLSAIAPLAAIPLGLALRGGGK